MSTNSNSPATLVVASFAAGVAVALIASKVLAAAAGGEGGGSRLLNRGGSAGNSDDDRTHGGATVDGNDLSLFYGNVTELTTVTNARKFLPSQLYGQLVQDCVVCCVDCLLVRRRNGTKECLLILRSSEPVKGVWWLPGGRLLKGETFFAAAKRKAQQETGLTNVTPIQVLGVWNTFFPTSNWDTPTSKGTQTVNPIVLVELNDDGAEVKLDDTSEEWRWISLDPDEAQRNGEDKYVLQALLRLRDWDPTYHKA